MEYFGRITIETLLFWMWLSFVSCEEENSVHYEHVPELNGKICPSADITFMQTAVSKIECTLMCKNGEVCNSIVYSPDDMTCSGCSRTQYEPSSLRDSPGAVFYKSSIVDCGLPSFDDPHVLLGHHNGDNSGGASIAYSCQPCTYFPNSTEALVMCLDVGVWSSPLCVCGADVGYLHNGVSVPSDAKGCVSEMGNTCFPLFGVPGGFTMKGTTETCVCDDICCGYEDCCFDADCFSP